MEVGVIGSRKNKDFLWIASIFLFGVIGHFAVGNFLKEITTYPDELRYYLIARSIFDGQGLTIRGIPTDFQKLAYSLILVPFFYIKNALIRVQYINLLNSVLMMLSIFPVWFIGKELQFKRITRYFLVCLVVIWPDLMMTSTLMAENLYLPFALFFMYLWVRNEREKSYWLSIALGLTCFFGYLIKEIFLVFFLAYFAFEVLYPIIGYHLQDRSTKIPIKNYFHKERFIHLGLFCFAFFAFFLLLKLTVFREMGNSYNQQGIDAILHKYNFLYMLYAILYYLVAIVVASFVIPIAFPLVFFNKLDEIAKKLYVFVILCFGIAVVTIAYTISVREDLGRVTPRLHFRYLSPLFILVFLVFACLIQDLDADDIKKRSRLLLEVIAANAIMILTVFRGLFRSSVDGFNLESYRFFCDHISDPLPPPGENQYIYLGALLANTLIVICIFLYVILLKKKKIANGFLIALIIIVCMANNYVSFDNVYLAYKIDATLVDEAVAIDSWVDELDGDFKILYLTDETRMNNLSKAIDTYVDATEHVMYVDSSAISCIELGNSMPVSQMEFREQIWNDLYPNENSVDYIIVENTTGCANRELTNVQIVETLCGENFTVYRNLDPSAISVKDELQFQASEFSQNDNVAMVGNYTELLPGGTVFGPYVFFAAGKYNVSIYGRNLNSLVFDVWSESQGELFDLSDVRQSDGKISYTFDLDIDISDLELRLYNRSDETAQFSHVIVNN